MAHASPVWSLLNLLGRMVLSRNLSALTIKFQTARLKVQLKLFKVNWEGCQVENWNQSFQNSYSPTGQHSIPQLELHQQNCRWKGSYSQIWTGWGHPPLPQYSSAKIIRNSNMTEPPRCRCNRMFRRFFDQNFNSSPEWLARLLLKSTYALSFLINLQDGRVIRRQDHVRAIEINCSDVNPTATIFPRSRSITIVKIIFWNDGSLCWQDFFRLHRRKWISDVTATNSIFDVKAGNRKPGLFWKKTLVGADRLKGSSALDFWEPCGEKKFFSEL